MDGPFGADISPGLGVLHIFTEGVSFDLYQCASLRRPSLLKRYTWTGRLAFPGVVDRQAGHMGNGAGIK